MPSRTAALILPLVLLLSACAGRQVQVPYPVYVEIEKPQRLPDELLRPCVVHEQTGRRVKDYTKTAIVNTAVAKQCALQIEEIRKLQPED